MILSIMHYEKVGSKKGGSLSVFSLADAATENGTWFVGGGHMRYGERIKLFAITCLRSHLVFKCIPSAQVIVKIYDFQQITTCFEVI
ncbi:MAG: hypothetical protein QS721_08830 [Candidatus Endonucleobacter sp. (ex Gigantidas childressi)]|nr:hypothetical protein [Candidatus Endonucleobacter sp. (ex Gigantidas childressi)]